MIETLRFVWEDDETCHVDLNGTHIIDMEHGPHGWDGMVGIRDALLSLATIKSWVIVIEGDPGI